MIIRSSRETSADTTWYEDKKIRSHDLLVTLTLLKAKPLYTAYVPYSSTSNFAFVE
jgi:hypothetical protein